MLRYFDGFSRETASSTQLDFPGADQGKRRGRRWLDRANTWHLALYAGTTAAVVTNSDTAAKSDSGVLYITSNHFLLQQPMNIIALKANGGLLGRSRLDSGSIRYYGNPYIRPQDVSVLNSSNPNMMFIHERPFSLAPREEIAWQVTTTGAGADTQTLGMFIQPTDSLGYRAATVGPYWAIRLTSTTALVLSTWGILTYTLETSLPAGMYWMIYSELQSTNALYHRWFFDRQFWRPGFPSLTALGNRNPDILRPGLWGQMNVYPFVNDRLPALEAYANAADAAHEGYAYIIPATPPVIAGPGGMQPLATTYGTGA